MVPIAAVFLVLALQICLKGENYTWETIGIDVLLGGVSMSAWAVTAILSGRLATYGGVVAFGEFPEKLTKAVLCEALRWGAILLSQFAVMLLVANHSLCSFYPLNGVCLVVGLILPIAGLGGLLLPQDDFYANC
jgi:hypothetical protein